MAIKRGNNEGTIFRKPNGRWRAQVSIDGKRLSFTGKTRSECQDWLKKTITQIDHGMRVEAALQTVEEYLLEWLSVSQLSQRQTTASHYAHAVKAYLIPYIGDIKMKDLRPEHVQRLYSLLVEQGVGIYAIRKAHQVLHCALEHAVTMEVIHRNPASKVRPPRAPECEMAILDEIQVSKLLVTSSNHRWYALYQLAVTTGMRQGELLGLKWVDLDVSKKTIKVERQLSRTRNGGVQFYAPKTRSGRRTIALGQATIEVLQSHYLKQEEERRTAGDQWVDQGLIFTNSLGGPINHRNLLRNFKSLLRDAGLPDIRFHDLRHTSASLMLNDGIPLLAVSRRLGHARASITLNIYGHLVPGIQEEAAARIDEIVMPVPIEMVAPGCTRKSNTP
jgi:integrase